MPASGDLVTILSMDATRFTRGAAIAKNEMKSMQTASGGFGRGLTQVGFAAQDFFSILEMGGKGALSRAMMSTMNNVQMLGASFGPWGMAITAVGGAIGSILLPKLLEGAGAFEKTSEAIRESTERLDGFISRGKQMIDFREKLAGLDTMKGAGQTRKELETALERSKFESDALGKRIQQLQGERASLTQASKNAGKEAMWGTKWIAETWVEKMETGPAIKDIDKQIETLQKKHLAAAAEFGQILKQKDALKEEEPKVQMRELDALDTKQHDKDLDAIMKLREKYRTPLEKMREEMRHLAELRGTGLGSDDIFSRAEKAAGDEYIKALMHQTGHQAHGLSAGAVRGSAEAISLINRAVVQSQGDNERKQQLAEARRAVDLAKQQLAELKEIKNKKGPTPVALNQ